MKQRVFSILLVISFCISILTVSIYAMTVTSQTGVMDVYSYVVYHSNAPEGKSVQGLPEGVVKHQISYKKRYYNGAYQYTSYSYSLAPSPECPGYVFNGWYADESCTETYVRYAEGSHHALDIGTSSSPLNAYAKWTPHDHDSLTYTVNPSGDGFIESCSCAHTASAYLEIDRSVDLTYTGSPIEPAYFIYSDGWSGDKNLSITYTNNVNEGLATASAILEGITVNKTFEITPVVKVDAQPPTIFAQTNSLSVPVGESAALFVSASVSDGGTLRYQWYVSDTETGDGTEIPGATDAGYAPPTNTAGVQYYYVIITNTNANATGLQTASVKSAVMPLTVGAKKLYTISGSLITYGDAADVTIELLLNGEVIRTVPVADTTGKDTYSIDGVEAGTYTMRVSKPKHVTREYEVTVGNP